MATNFKDKIGKIGLFTSIRSTVALVFRNGSQYRHSDFEIFMSFIGWKAYTRSRSFFKTNHFRQITTEQISTKFSTCSSYLIVDYWFDPFSRRSRDVAMAKSADSPSFVALAFLNGLRYRNSDLASGYIKIGWTCGPTSWI